MHPRLLPIFSTLALSLVFWFSFPHAAPYTAFNIPRPDYNRVEFGQFAIHAMASEFGPTREELRSIYGQEVISTTESITQTENLSETVSITENATLDTDDVDTLDIDNDAVLDAQYAQPLEGTIIANRTTANVTFFLDGQLYRVAPLRSLGIQLLRDNSVINLYSCDADTPQTDSNCFWDPYLVNQDGFYEVFNDAPENFPLRLVIEEAGAPPDNQIWVQNRMTTREPIVYNNTVYELGPSAVQEFLVDSSPVIQFFLRSCISIDETTVCEWAPQTVSPGFYYTLNEVTTSGGLPNSRITNLILEPLIAQSGQVIEAPPQLLCQLQVPVVNIRSGPGLDYLIVTKVRGTEQESGTVLVVGRDPSALWFAVDERVAAGGWVTANENFVICNGDVSDLPLAEVTDGRLIPVQEATAAAEIPATETNTEGEGADESESGEVEATAKEPPAVAIPTGQAVLVVTNSFEHVIRFTLSPDEYDLQPQETVQIVVNPGRVQFTASSAWGGGLSGNAEFLIEPDIAFPMYLYFVPDPGDSDVWILQYQ
ncbi:hypothetical protein KFU94_47020 [Chloroflexi bacterium TSY]|nr:hypothetical protein [Chloroflexi bacterium TSY]